MDAIDAIDAFMFKYVHLFLYLIAGAALLTHFNASKSKLISDIIPMAVSMSIGILVVPAIFVLAFYSWRPAPLRLIVALLVVYGICLFILLSSAMIAGVAKFLTAKRGDKWTKEMDYVYLTMGGFGILLSMNRIEFLTGRYEIADMLAPLLLTTAVVIRFIKTRAEIAGWNK